VVDEQVKEELVLSRIDRDLDADEGESGAELRGIWRGCS
jgi:hypothetical protein